MKTGYIYCLTHKDTPNIIDYVGSTFTLLRRSSQHKYNCKTGKESHRPLYEHIRENGGWGSYYMEILDEDTFSDATELQERERNYILGINPLYNNYLKL
tara:strand:+ start:358 stop:654 length:297 start_codon:yes stop_codon:yes gene_type:complete